MSTNRWRATLVVLAVVVTAGGILTVAQAPEPDPATAMQAAMAAAQPGEHHQHLKGYAGTWTAVSRMWNPAAPDAPPMESKGKAVNTMVLGDRFLKMEYQGEMMGMSYQGMGLEGYDNLRNKHVQTWVDSMGTSIMNAEGTCSDDGKRRTLVGDSLDPTTGGTMTLKQVIEKKSDTEHLWTMYMVMPDGSEMRLMDITYRR